MPRRLVAVCLAALALRLPAPAGADDGPGGLRAGAFALYVTPQKLPISLKGGMLDRLVTIVSSTLSTRMPRLTLARIGFSAVSKASSVMLKSVMRTGTMRFLLQTNSDSADSIGTISSVPDCAS